MRFDITLIISMYNIERGIDSCLRSIEKQLEKFPSVEVLLIDDGSTDKTPQIANEYVKRCNQMHYFYKPNGGVSTTRNYGLSKAEGVFVWFIDGDDEIVDDALELLLNRIRGCEAEIVTFDFFLYENGYKRCISKHGVFVDGQSFTGIDYLKHFYVSAVWQHVYRRDFLLREKLFFKEGLVHEDNEFEIRAFAKTKQMSYANICIYVYHRYSAKETLSKVKSLRDACSVFPLIESSYLMEKKTKMGVIAYQGAFVMNVILSCDYTCLPRGDRKIFECEFVKTKKQIVFCYMHSKYLWHKLQSILIFIHPLCMIRIWMCLLDLRKIYAHTFHHQ